MKSKEDGNPYQQLRDFTKHREPDEHFVTGQKLGLPQPQKLKPSMYPHR